MHTLADPFNLLLISLFFGLSTISIFYTKRQIGFMAIASLLIVIAQDQMRWQPWVYLYLLMLIPYLTQSGKGGNEKQILICLQLVIAGVYVWSGVQKMNSNFLDGTFAQIMRAFGFTSEFEVWRKLGYAIPLAEVSIGVALLIPKLRTIGICAATFTHILILLYLSPLVLNHNSVVYPWNVAMILFVFLLFYNVNDNLLTAVSEVRSSALLATIIMLVWIAPIFNLLGYWDHYLSFSLYSNKPSIFYVAVAESELHKIDKRFSNYFARIRGLQGGAIIEIDKWAISELNVPFYPETRSFKKLSENFCGLGIDDDKLVFLELSYQNREPYYTRFTCKQPLRP
jgi:hypothetical protein